MFEVKGFRECGYAAQQCGEAPPHRNAGNVNAAMPLIVTAIPDISGVATSPKMNLIDKAQPDRTAERRSREREQAHVDLEL